MTTSTHADDPCQIAIWKSEITAGNHYFNRQQFDDALRHYQNAKTVACALFPHWSDTHAAVSAVVVSYHNLADLYLQAKMPMQAGTELRDSHNFVINALRDEERYRPPATHPDQILVEQAQTRMDALLRAASRTYLALTQHLERYSDQSKQAVVHH